MASTLVCIGCCAVRCPTQDLLVGLKCRVDYCTSHGKSLLLALVDCALKNVIDASTGLLSAWRYN